MKTYHPLTQGPTLNLMSLKPKQRVALGKLSTGIRGAVDANVHGIAAVGHLGLAKTNKVLAVSVEGDLRFGGDGDAVDVLCLAVFRRSG